MTSDHISNGGSHVSILSAIPFYPEAQISLLFCAFSWPFFASSERYGREIIFENRTSSAFPIWIGKSAQRIKPFSGKKPRKSDNKVLLVLMGLLFWDFQTVCAQNVSPCFSEKMGRKTEGMTDRRAQSFHLSISQIIIGLQSSKKVTKFANQTLLWTLVEPRGSLHCQNWQ